MIESVILCLGLQLVGLLILSSVNLVHIEKLWSCPPGGFEPVVMVSKRALMSLFVHFSKNSNSISQKSRGKVKEVIF